MAVTSIKAKEAKERGILSGAVPLLQLARGQQDLTYMAALAEATRERELAALRISKLARQAVDTLLHLVEEATYS